jgi:hypothetical protein
VPQNLPQNPPQNLPQNPPQKDKFKKVAPTFAHVKRRYLRAINNRILLYFMRNITKKQITKKTKKTKKPKNNFY